MRVMGHGKLEAISLYTFAIELQRVMIVIRARAHDNGGKLLGTLSQNGAVFHSTLKDK